MSHIVITAHAWMNESGSGVDHASDMVPHRTAQRAGTAGMRALAHDDFLIGEVHGGHLVSLLTAHGEPLNGWGRDDFEDVAEALNLRWESAS